MAYFLDNYPVSEKSSDLVLTEEQEKYCRVVYKLDEKGGAVFSELWDPEAKYSDEYVIVPFRSTGGTLEAVGVGTPFANVLGSSADPLPSGQSSWLKYWLNLMNISGWYTECSTDKSFYYINGNGQEQKHQNILYPKKNAQGYRENVNADARSCYGGLVGGHVILNATEANTVPENCSAYIIAICDKHNVSHTSSGSWGEGFYMRVGKEHLGAIKLENYLNGIREYLEEHKDEVRHE